MSDILWLTTSVFFCSYRLEDYDRNYNFGQLVADPQASSYCMKIPDVKTYRDVTSSTNLPKVTDSAVDIYLSPVDGSMAPGKRLYDSTYVFDDKINLCHDSSAK